MALSFLSLARAKFQRRDGHETSTAKLAEHFALKPLRSFRWGNFTNNFLACWNVALNNLISIYYSLHTTLIHSNLFLVRLLEMRGIYLYLFNQTVLSLAKLKSILFRQMSPLFWGKRFLGLWNFGFVLFIKGKLHNKRAYNNASKKL